MPTWIKTLEKRITIYILTPVFIGVLALALLSSLYFPNFYIGLINDYSLKILAINNEVLSSVSMLSSISISLSILQNPVNLIAIGGRLIEQDLVNNSLQIKPSFTGFGNYISSVLFDDFEITPPGYIPGLNASFKVAEWYLNEYSTSNLFVPDSVKTGLYHSAVYDSVLRPAARIPSISNPLVNSIYLGWNDSGLFYTNPTTHLNFGANLTRYTNCSYTISDPHYDPRCRPWFVQTQNTENKASVILTDPYSYISGEIGITACQGIWNASSLLVVLCADLKIGNLSQSFASSLKKSEYNYILSSTSEQVVYYFQQEDLSKSIQQIEFKGNEEETREFNKHILPLFNLNRVTNAKFVKNGVEHLISIAPITITSGLNKQILHLASLATVIEEKVITSWINSLESYCTEVFIVEGVVILILLVGIMYFFWFLTSSLARSIVRPIDTLNQALGRLVKHDFAMDLSEKTPETSTDLYKVFKVFEKLRVILKFKDESSFKNDANAIISYAQALELFEDFGNHSKVQMCLIEIGLVSIKQGRVLEGCDYLNKAIENHQGPYEEKISLKVIVADCWMKEKIRTEEAENYMIEALGYYEDTQDFSAIGYALTSYAYGMILVNKSSEFLIGQCKLKLHKLSNAIDFEIISQKILMCEALALLKKDLATEANSKLLAALTEFSYYDPEVRSICIEKLQIPGLKSLSSLANLNIISLVVQDKLLKINQTLVQTLKIYLNETDKISISVYGKHIKTLQHISNMFEFRSFSESLGNKSNLYDAIFYGIQHLRTQVAEGANKWIVVLCDGVESGSEIQFEKIVKYLKKYDAKIIILVYGNVNEEVARICDNVEFGVIFDSSAYEDVQSICQQVVATILPSLYIRKTD